MRGRPVPRGAGPAAANPVQGAVHVGQTELAECSAVAALLGGSREMQSDGFECRDPLHGSRAGCPYCFAALNVGLRPPPALDVGIARGVVQMRRAFAKRRRVDWRNQQGSVAGLDWLRLVR